MKIKAGDIVKSRVPAGRSIDEPWWSMTASTLFYDGYYMVLEVLVANDINDKGRCTSIAVCKIMDHHGQFNWISTKKLIKIL